MTDILFWIFLSGLLLVAFLIILVIGLIKRKRKAILSSLFILIAFLCCAAITAYKVVAKSYNKAKTIDLVKSKTTETNARSGENIYGSLFGKSSINCLDVTNHQDHSVPFLDCCIWLELKTCPDEMQRLLKQERFELSKADKLLLDLKMPNSGERPKWWNPMSLGDTVLVYEYHHSDADRKQVFFLSTDSSRAFYYDMVY